MEITILYEDKHLFLCRKPAGVPSQPDPSGQESLLSMLQARDPSVSLVHRLDTPTGGVMVFGRTPQATAKLCTMVQDHAVFCKEYLALVAGSLPEDTGIWNDFLYHDKRANKAYVVDKARKGSKEAILSYRVLGKTENGYSLVLVRLFTGRTHQIRVQFASRGFPLVGDGKYGSREKAPHIALWAYSLTFPHPIKQDPVTASTKPCVDHAPWSYAEALIRKL